MILRLLSPFLLIGFGFHSLTTASPSLPSKNLTAVLAEADQALDETDALLGSAESLMQHAAIVMDTDVPSVDTLLAQVASETLQVEHLIRQVNAIQLQELSDKLEEIRDKEIVRRHREGLINGGGVTVAALQEAFHADNILPTSEAQLQEWIVSIVMEEMLELKKSVASTGDTDNCVTPELAVNMVQQALLNYSQDDIGLEDHAAAGSIIHEFTADTYQPPPAPNQLLGGVWWNKYIPADWEAFLLPTGWQYWNVGLPSALFHSLRSSSAATAPPETILHSNTLPGSCWPMQGSRGNVMIALPYAVKVTAVSLDHTQSFLLTNADKQLQSAPKRVQVTGYAPCTRTNCAGLGFDPTQKFVIANVEYSIEQGESGSIQTWPVMEEPLEVAEQGACSATFASCDSGLDSTTAAGTATSGGIYSAIEVSVLDNHGNDDYTCLYRFRVHGEPATLA
jgi:SUN domain-containing protein 1/2